MQRIILNTKRPFLLDFMQMSIGKVREEEPGKWLTLGLFWLYNLAIKSNNDAKMCSFWPFWYGWVEIGLNGQNGWTKLKSCGHPRIKFKNILWLGDLKASLRIDSKKLIHKTSSSVRVMHLKG